MVVTEWERLVLKEHRLCPEQGQCFDDLLLVSSLWFCGFCPGQVSVEWA